MRHEHEVAARAALADLRAHHERELIRIKAAISALDDVTAPAVLHFPPEKLEPTAPIESRPVVSDRRPVKQQPRIDYAEVAKVCRAAIDDHRPLSGAVVAAFNVTSAAASQMIMRARDAGENIPRLRQEPANKINRREPSATPDHGIAYRCVTCDERFDEKQKLASHTITAHRRGPLQEENAGVAA